MMPMFDSPSSIQAIVLWGAFTMVSVLAFILYVVPRRLSGPITSAERRATRGHLAALMRRWLPPTLALLGLGILLPPLDPPRVEFTSWLVRAEHRGPAGLECLVPQLLEKAARDVREHGASPREALRLALLGAPLSFDEVACPKTFAFPPELRDAEIESLELSVVMLAARIQASRSIEVEVRTASGDIDPWALLERAMTRWAHVSVDTRQPAYGSGVVHAVDRAVVGPERIELWVMLERATACAPISPLPLDLGDGTTCSLRWESPRACTSPEGPRTLAIHAACPLTSPIAGVSHARLEGIEVPLDLSEPTTIRVEGVDAWRTARRAAARNGALVADLAASGLALPEEDDDAGVLLRTVDAQLQVEGPRRCPAGPAPKDIVEQGPFSWAGTGLDEPISISPEGIDIRVGGDALDPKSKIYEPTMFGAAMRSISWAAHCLRQCSCTTLRPPPRGGEPRPLLTQGEVDELVGRARQTRDALGVLLVGLSLLMLTWWGLAARRAMRSPSADT